MDRQTEANAFLKKRGVHEDPDELDQQLPADLNLQKRL